VPAKGTRPTTDRTREALFNLLSARRDFEGLRVLDLYAGSGALGLEALSRGAESVLFVESDAQAAKVLAANIDIVGLPGAVVRRGQVMSVLGAGADAPMDLVLADPPYDLSSQAVQDVVAALSTGGWIADDTVIVIERSVTSTPVDWPSGWTVWPQRRYGDTRLELAEVNSC